MTVKSSISLTDQQHAFAKSLVDDGRYASLSAVIQQGLDTLRAREEETSAARSAFLALLDQRRGGPFLSSEELDARMDIRKRDLRRELGLSD